MKKLIVLILFVPAMMRAQACKPYADLNGHSGTSEISLSELSSLSKLTVAGTCHGEKYFITSYEFTMMRNNQPLSMTGIGYTLSEKIKGAMASAAAGTKIYFDLIHAKGPGGKVIDVAGITLKLKN